MHDIICCHHSIQHTNKCPWCFRKYNDTPRSTYIIVELIITIFVAIGIVAYVVLT